MKIKVCMMEENENAMKNAIMSIAYNVCYFSNFVLSKEESLRE